MRTFFETIGALLLGLVVAALFTQIAENYWGPEWGSSLTYLSGVLGFALGCTVGYQLAKRAK